MTKIILGTKTASLTIGSNILSITEYEAVIDISLNGRKFSPAVCEKAFNFGIKNKLTQEELLACISSILNHPNQLSLEPFLDNCLAGTISFVFLGDRAGVGSKELARDVWSFDSLDEMKNFSENIALMSITPPKDEGKNFWAEHDRKAAKILLSAIDSGKSRYKNNYSIRGKDGRFTKQSPMEIGTRIHQGWEKVFNAHTPPPIPSNYNYYNNLKRGTPEYNGSRQFVKNYVSQNSVSVKEAIKVFNQGVANFGAQFESLVKTCPNLVHQSFPPIDKVTTYYHNFQSKYGCDPTVRNFQKRFKEYRGAQDQWQKFLAENIK